MKKLTRKKTVPKSQASHLPAPNVIEAAEKLAEAAFGISASPQKLGNAMYEFEMEIRKDEARKQQ